jgi:hypothetical protein
MENYVAESITPVERCIQDVNDCDIYILILANRYGFIPPGSEKSVTETEYESARAGNKKIFAFITEDASFPHDEGPGAEEKVKKLAQFREAVRGAYLTHADEQFITPDSLVVQLSETLMKDLLKDYFIADLRKYCCDRKQQFSDYMLHKATGRFKVFLVHGHKDELGRDLINRFLYFTINNDVQQTLTFHCFNNFMQSDYDKAKEKLIINILTDDLKIGHSNAALEPDFATLVNKLNYRKQQDMVIVFSDDVISFDPKARAVLKQFLHEFYTYYKVQGKKEMYIFINIQDEGDSNTTEVVHDLLSCNSQEEVFLFELQRLEKGNTRIIDQWISSYLIRDEGCIRELLDTCFAPLLQQKNFTMYEADKSIRRFLKKVNTRDKEVFDILNIYS